MNPHLQRLESVVNRREKIAMLTCYDATFAKLMELAGVDMLLVGDSLGMVLQGAENTLQVTLEQMIYHVKCVAAGAPSTLILADMPVNTYEFGGALALENAQMLIDAGAHMVKFEGGGKLVETAYYLVEHGIPVCAHLGFTPQSVEKIGGYKIQGKTPESAQEILQDAQAMKDAGASLVLLEMVPAALAKQVTAIMPTIGIGAGVDCSGQVLVLQDLLGIYNGPANKAPKDYKAPRFAKNFLTETNCVQQAVINYVKSVKNQSFPLLEHSY